MTRIGVLALVVELAHGVDRAHRGLAAVDDREAMEGTGRTRCTCDPMRQQVGVPAPRRTAHPPMAGSTYPTPMYGVDGAGDCMDRAAVRTRRLIPRGRAPARRRCTSAGSREFDAPERGRGPLRRAVRAHRRAAWRTRRATASGSRACRSACTTRCGSTTPGFDPGAPPAPRRRAGPRRARRRDAVDAAGARPAAVGDLDRRRAARRRRADRQDAPLHGRRRRRGRARQPAARRRRRTAAPRRRRPTWSPAPAPSAGRAAARGALRPHGRRAPRSRSTPLRARGVAAAAAPPVARAARGRGTTLLCRPRPRSPLNRPGSARRHHVRVTRALDELRAVRRRFRRDAQRRPAGRLRRARCGARTAARRATAALKAMVPADVRVSERRGERQPHLVRVHRAAVRRARPGRAPAGRPRAPPRSARRDGEAETLDAAFRRPRAHAAADAARARARASPTRALSNLTISSVPGPAVPRYLRGCRLREVHSAVPLADRHALSIGVVMAAGKRLLRRLRRRGARCPTPTRSRDDLDAALDELA